MISIFEISSVDESDSSFLTIDEITENIQVETNNQTQNNIIINQKDEDSQMSCSPHVKSIKKRRILIPIRGRIVKKKSKMLTSYLKHFKVISAYKFACLL